MGFLRVTVFCVVLGALGHSPYAHAQSFAVGYMKYQKGDFPGAEAALAQALKTARNASERAKMLKFRGIAQHMQGNTNGARSSFKEALGLFPTLTINPSDVLDETVIQFFNDVRTAVSAEGPKTKRETTAGVASANSTGNASDKVTKVTLLKVISTPSETQVSIDGILAGRSGELINTNPGTVPVTITAPGYEAKELNVTIAKNRENIVKIVLDKVKPKAKPTSKPKEAPVANSGSGGARKKDASLAAPTSAPTAPTGPDLAQQFEMDTAIASTPPPGTPYFPPGYGAPGYYPGYPYRPGGSSAGYRYRSAEPDYLLLMLPFGVGQFYQDRNVAGLFFLGAEAGGIYTALGTYNAVKKNAAQEVEFKAKCPTLTNEIDKAKCEDFVTKAGPFRRSANQKITGLSIFVFGLMLWGAADAILKDPDYLAPPPPRRNRRSTGAARGQDSNSPPLTPPMQTTAWNWHLALLPVPAYDGASKAGESSLPDASASSPSSAPSLLWNVEWNF